MGLDYKATIATSDYKYIIRELNKVEPDLVKALKKDFREIGNTVRQGIQGEIPADISPKLRQDLEHDKKSKNRQGCFAFS